MNGLALSRLLSRRACGEDEVSGYATGSAAARVQVAYIGFWFDVG